MKLQKKDKFSAIKYGFPKRYDQLPTEWKKGT